MFRVTYVLFYLVLLLYLLRIPTTRWEINRYSIIRIIPIAKLTAKTINTVAVASSELPFMLAKCVRLAGTVEVSLDTLHH